MALTYEEINAYTNAHIVPRATEVTFKNDPLLARLMARKMVRFNGGRWIQRPLTYAELNGKFFSRGDTFNTDFVPTDTALQVEMKFAEVGITLYGTDAVLNQGPNAVFSQIGLKFNNAALTMSKLLSTAMYKDGQSSDANVVASGGLLSLSNSVTGLLAWIDDGSTSGSYPTATDLTRSFASVGNIIRADIATCPSSGNSTPTANITGLNAYTNRTFNTFSLIEIQNAVGNAWFGTDFVDTIVTGQLGYNKFVNSVQPMQRYAENKSDLANIGFKTIRFDTSEVVISKYIPDGLMFGLNTSYLEFYVSQEPLFQYGFTGFKQPANSIDNTGQYLWAGNILHANPRTCFKLVGNALR